MKSDVKSNVYQQDDFVLIKSRAAYHILRKDDGKCRLFQIKEVLADGYRLRDVQELVPFNEIEPVPINNEEAHLIYYECFGAAGFIAPGELPPVSHTDYSYFMEAFKNILRNNDTSETYYDAIVKSNMMYVHEVQHWIQEQGHGPSELRINDIPLLLAFFSKTSHPRR